MNETDKPLVAGMAKTKILLDCGDDTIYGLIKARQLDSYLEGKSRKITMASIERLIEKRLAADPGKFERAGDMRKLRRLSPSLNLPLSARPTGLPTRVAPIVADDGRRVKIECAGFIGLSWVMPTWADGGRHHRDR
jgi:hypothetical protein